MLGRASTNTDIDISGYDCVQYKEGEKGDQVQASNKDEKDVCQCF
jgi:hypothetical protein